MGSRSKRREPLNHNYHKTQSDVMVPITQNSRRQMHQKKEKSNRKFNQLKSELETSNKLKIKQLKPYNCDFF